MTTPLSTSFRSPDGRQPVWVAAVALLNAEYQVLMQRRPHAGAHGGLWEFPGGKLETGESPQDAAARELGEELGVAILSRDLTPVAFASGETTGGGPERPLVILLHACRTWQGTPQPHAASELRWCDWHSLASLDMPPLDYPLAEALRRFLVLPAF